MIDDAVVIDGVAHGYNLDPSNFVGGPRAAKFARTAYELLHKSLSPADDPRYTLREQQFVRTCDPELLASCLFEESQTDLAVYHAPQLVAFFKDGGSPMSTGKHAAELAPGRMYFYGSVYPFDTARAIDELDQQIEENGIIGLKFYPNDLYDGQLRSFRMDDEKIAFPIFEHALKRGIRSIAIHKAVILGPLPQPNFLKDFRLDDIEVAALTFRKLNFEIVHGGWAFLEDTVMLAQVFRNVYVNLEGPSAFLNFAPRRFAHLMGSLMQAGAEDRIIWATGAMAVHPRPLIEKFWKFEIPEDLIEGYGYPQLTSEVKRKVFAENFARMHAMNVQELVAAIPNDEQRLRQVHGVMAEPWSKAPVNV